MVTSREQPRPADLVGRRIGGYTLERLLGEGGMGSVYLAQNGRIGRSVAIKIIARQYTQDPEIVGRFFREARAVAALDDPNVIEIYDCHEFAEDGLTYISMKFIEGHSLAALLAIMGVLPIDAAVAIALQIASGLDAAHEQGIVHRDIKPENVLISSRWRRRYFATILDFGIAKLLDPHLAANYRTKTSLVIGTLGYMAPEQARGERDIDAGADIYALGVVLYELLTGRRPYDAETVYGLVEKHTRRAAFPRPRELRPEIPQMVDELLLDMLQIDRRKRPATMKEVGQRLVAGVANGDLMLRTLAARLCVGRPASAHEANEPTLIGDVESAITRWTPARSAVRRRRSMSVPVAAAGIVACAAFGGGAAHFTFGRKMETPAVVPVASPAPHLPAPVAIKLEPVAMKSEPVAAKPEPEAAKPEPEAAKPEPEAAKPEPVAARPAPVAAKPELTKPEQSATRQPTRPAVDAVSRQDGYLVVRIHSWADVWIDGRRAATAPVRLKLPAGQYTVRLANDSHDETVKVSVGGKAEAVVEKSW